MIIAIDFDLTINLTEYPNIGEVAPDAIDVIKKLKEEGHYIIVWTCRDGKLLSEAIDWLREIGVPFDAVNAHNPENLAQYGGDTRKVYADLYIDDKQVGGLPSWKDIYSYVASISMQDTEIEQPFVLDVVEWSQGYEYLYIMDRTQGSEKLTEVQYDPRINEEVVLKRVGVNSRSKHIKYLISEQKLDITVLERSLNEGVCQESLYVFDFCNAQVLKIEKGKDENVGELFKEIGLREKDCDWMISTQELRYLHKSVTMLPNKKSLKL